MTSGAAAQAAAPPPGGIPNTKNIHHRFEEGHLRRLADSGADKRVVTQRSWMRAIPFARGLTIVTYTQT
jgi:hypothetical protein